MGTFQTEERLVINSMNEYKVNNKRLSKYLYSLGFNKKSIVDSNNEYWLFEKNNNLKEALDFYFYMRDKNRK